MTRPWQVIDAIDSEEGRLELRQRGDDAYIITIDGRVLMNSTAHTSEVALARMACERIEGRNSPRVLIGGLGMAYTLRATLDGVPADARVTVAELNATVVQWCRGPIADLTDASVKDPRVDVRVEDVTAIVRRGKAKFDAIIYDLYEGPHAATQKGEDPLYGPRALRSVKQALKSGGVFAVWGEQHDPPFEERLRRAGFDVHVDRPGRGALRHVVYLGTP